MKALYKKLALLMGFLLILPISVAFAAESDAPPSLNIEIPEDEEGDEIEITDVDVDPESFDSTKTSTDINFTLSKDAIVEIKIFNSDDDLIATIADDEEMDDGENTVKWYGREGNVSTGQAVSIGEYQIKITAKNPDTEDTEDTAEANVDVIRTTTTNPTPTPNPSPTSNQNQATMALQNATSGSTADTGPGVLIYFLFPVAGYFLSKKVKK